MTRTTARKRKTRKRKTSKPTSKDVLLSPGFTGEILPELERWHNVKPVQIWRGLTPVGEYDYLGAERTKAQLPGMRTTTLLIGDRSIEVFPSSYRELYEDLQIEYGWKDMLFTTPRGDYVTEGWSLAGGTFRVKEVIHRKKCASVRFPGEKTLTKIYKEPGREIKQWIKAEVGTECKVRVICRGCMSCDESVDPDEIYDDTQFGITLIGSLPPVKPTNHSVTRNPSYRQRREHEAWQTLQQRGQEIEIRYFRDAQSGRDPEVKYYGNRLWRECAQVQKDWLENELVKMNPEQVNPPQCETQVWNLIGKKISELALRRWGEFRGLQDIEERKFCSKSFQTYKCMYPVLEISDKVQERANLWPSERDAYLTMAVQKMDGFLQMQNAETCWAITCGNPMLKYMNQEIVHNRALEIRMLCMDDVVLETVSVRCWNQILKAERLGTVQREIDRHLKARSKKPLLPE
jgi:hypothetical protein